MSKSKRRVLEMIRTLAISAVAAAGLLLLPGQASVTSAAPSIAPKIATPESAVEQVRRRGGGGFRGGRSFRGHSFRGGRSFGRSWGGRSYRRHYSHRHYRHRHGWRRGVVIGAGFPFFYGGYGYYGGYSSCGYYYRKWMRTGSRYWRNRYHQCRYW
jgi:hypothetical protein